MLAERCACHPDALHRVLRLLETARRVPQRTALLVAHADVDAAAQRPPNLDPRLRPDDRPTRQLGADDPTGRISANAGVRHPCSTRSAALFAYLARHPDQLAVFDQAMTAKAHADVERDPHRGRLLPLPDDRRHRRRLRSPHPGNRRPSPRRAWRPRRPPAGHRPSRTARASRVVRGRLLRRRAPAGRPVDPDAGHPRLERHRRRTNPRCGRHGRRTGATVMLFEWLLPEHPTDDAANVDRRLHARRHRRPRTHRRRVHGTAGPQRLRRHRHPPGRRSDVRHPSRAVRLTESLRLDAAPPFEAERPCCGDPVSDAATCLTRDNRYCHTSVTEHDAPPARPDGVPSWQEIAEDWLAAKRGRLTPGTTPATPFGPGVGTFDGGSGRARHR